MTRPVLALTPTRVWLLRAIRAGDVYREAGQDWHKTQGTKLTARVTEMDRAGWIRPAPGDRPGRTGYTLTDVGDRILAVEDLFEAGPQPGQVWHDAHSVTARLKVTQATREYVEALVAYSTALDAFVRCARTTRVPRAEWTRRRYTPELLAGDA